MKLALGTVQFGLAYGIANREGQVTTTAAAAIVRCARAAGMDTLDTAAGYGDSEARLGTIGVSDWRVVSKLPPFPEPCDDISEWATATARASLTRLKVPELYGLLLHRPDQLLGPGGDRLFDALQQLKAEGLVRKIGVSIYDPSELDALWPRFRCDLVQAPFNLLDRRLITSGWLTRLAAEGVELHVRSVFLQGLLLMSQDHRPQNFDRWDGLWNEYHQWLYQTRLTPVQACVRYAMSFPEIAAVVVGVDSVDQLTQILQAMDGPLIDIPETIGSDDLDLVNPARWTTFA
jgi:aryl-alcohol dehydrogenase-like predicted oxidoreductase